MSGAVGSNECPAGSVRIETAAACRTAATATGKTPSSSFVETYSYVPRGCYSSTSTNAVFFNTDPVGAGYSAAKLLCATATRPTGALPGTHAQTRMHVYTGAHSGTWCPQRHLARASALGVCSGTWRAQRRTVHVAQCVCGMRAGHVSAILRALCACAACSGAARARCASALCAHCSARYGGAVWPVLVLLDEGTQGYSWSRVFRGTGRTVGAAEYHRMLPLRRRILECTALLR